MKTVRMYGKPHKLADIFVEGKVGFADRSSPDVNVIPHSETFETLSYPSYSYGRPVTVVVHRITCADGTIHTMYARWVRKIGYVTIDPATQQVSWADDEDVG